MNDLVFSRTAVEPVVQTLSIAGPWTRFMDMHSGGGTKAPPYEYIYIQAPRAEAEVIFQNRFGRNPYRITCTCCGEDYSVDEDVDLLQATAYQRGCAYTYFDPQGNEVPEDEAWVRGKGMKSGYRGGYIERARNLYGHQYELIPLEAYLAYEKVLVIWEHEIKPEERVGALREEGYIWRD